MHPLEIEIQSIVEQYQMGNISEEEQNYLLQEIRDIRAAQDCAGNEVLFRHLVQCCNIAMKLV
jgi:hypothetical protein